MTTLLDVEHLSVRLPTASGPITIVDDVSYQVEQGKVFGVAGESGSGKTISVLALMRLLPDGARHRRQRELRRPRPAARCAGARCRACAGPRSRWSSRIR